MGGVGGMVISSASTTIKYDEAKLRADLSSLDKSLIDQIAHLYNAQNAQARSIVLQVPKGNPLIKWSNESAANFGLTPKIRDMGSQSQITFTKAPVTNQPVSPAAGEQVQSGMRDELFAKPSLQTAMNWENARSLAGTQASVPKNTIPIKVDSPVLQEQAIIASTKETFEQKLRADLRTSQAGAPRISEDAIKFLSKMYGTSYRREFVFGNVKNAKGLESWIKENGSSCGLSIQGDFSKKGADGLYHVYVSSKKQAQVVTGTSDAEILQGAQKLTSPSGGAQNLAPRLDATQKTSSQQLGITPGSTAAYISGRRIARESVKLMQQQAETSITKTAAVGKPPSQIGEKETIYELTSVSSPVYAFSSSPFVETEFAPKYIAPPSTEPEAKEHAIFTLLSLAKQNGFLPADFNVENTMKDKKAAITALQGTSQDFWKNIGSFWVTATASMEKYTSGAKGVEDARTALSKNITLALQRQEFAMKGLQSVLNECGFTQPPDHNSDILNFKNEATGTELTIVRGSVYVGGEEIAPSIASSEAKIKGLDISQISTRQLNGFLSALAAIEINGEKKGEAQIKAWEKAGIIKQNNDNTYTLLKPTVFNSQIARFDDKLKTGRKENDPADLIVRTLYSSRGISYGEGIMQSLSLDANKFVKREGEGLVALASNELVKKGEDVYIELSAKRKMQNGEFEDKGAAIDFTVTRYSYDPVLRAWAHPESKSAKIVEEEGKKYIKFSAGSLEDAYDYTYIVQAKARSPLGMETEFTQLSVSEAPKTKAVPRPPRSTPMRQTQHVETVLVSVPNINPDGASALIGSFLPNNEFPDGENIRKSFFTAVNTQDREGIIAMRDIISKSGMYDNWLTALGGQKNFDLFWERLANGDIRALDLLQDNSRGRALRNAFAVVDGKMEVRKLAEQFSYDVVRYGGNASISALKDKNGEDILRVGITIAQTKTKVELDKQPILSTTTSSYGADIVWMFMRKEDFTTLFGLDVTQVRQSNEPLSYIIGARTQLTYALRKVFSVSATTMGSVDVANGLRPTFRGFTEATLNATVARRASVGIGPVADFTDIRSPKYGFTVPVSVNLGAVNPYVRLDYVETPTIYAGLIFDIGRVRLSPFGQQERR